MAADAVRVATAASLIEAADPAGRISLLTAATRAPLGFFVQPGPLDQLSEEASGASALLRDLVRRELAQPTRVVALPSTDKQAAAVGLQLADGNWLLAHVDEGGVGRPPGPPLPLVVAMVSLAGALTGASLWVSSRVTRPLARFAAAVDNLQPEGTGEIVAEIGPLEIRRAAAALNRMRERIGRLLAERNRMLAAIGHDLRAPLTRLRLRVEGLDASPTHTAIVQDLGRMETLLGSGLTYLRGREVDEPRAAVDLPSLVQSVLDRHQDLGHDVAYHGPDHLTYRCRPLALERAIDNLLANATQFAARVDVTITVLPAGDLQLDVSDDGPGVPADQRELVLAPFYRGDLERDPARPGFGLGLSIVAEIVAAEDGRLQLLERQPHGLVVRIQLPRLL